MPSHALQCTMACRYEREAYGGSYGREPANYGRYYPTAEKICAKTSVLHQNLLLLSVFVHCNHSNHFLQQNCKSSYVEALPQRIISMYNSTAMSLAHAGRGTPLREGMVDQPMVNQDMSVVHMVLAMAARHMTEAMMTGGLVGVKPTAAGVQHQLAKERTPGLVQRGIMHALQHEHLGHMKDRHPACLHDSIARG